jgi:hypothetical protein
MHRAGQHPAFFGKTLRSRFDDPEGKFGVLYLGASERCAFIETFGQQTGQSFVTTWEVSQRALSAVRASRPLRVVDLDGPTLARLGADAEIFAGSHEIAQVWSRAIHEHPDRPMGLRFRAKHDPQEFSVALYERAASALRWEPPLPLDSPRAKRLLALLLDYYQFGLID